MKSFFLGTLAMCASAVSVSAAIPRSKTLLDEGWRFHFSDVAEEDAAEVAAVDFVDDTWRVLDLPHDWSIELPISEEDLIQQGIGYFEDKWEAGTKQGVGWYRKTLNVEPSWPGNRVVLEFEGVYRNAEVFVNGKKAGEHPWGFTPFTVDLTEHVEGLAVGEPVLIAVRTSSETDRFMGAGIYRNVWLHVFGETHIALNGLYPVTTALSKKEATLRVEATIGSVERNGQGFRKVRVDFSVFELDREGRASRRHVTKGKTLGTLVSAETRFAAELKIPNPRPWSPESPSLYRVVAQLRDESGTLLDESEVVTGVRTLAWSAERGLELNGVSIKLNGGNVRHDVGILGAAAFDRAEERKVQRLLDAGFNAVRTAHNPFSPAFLSACDRLGLLVIDEMFFSWVVPKEKHGYHELWDEWRKYDVEAWVRRDRHHPSVIFWSIGNEIPESGKPEGGAIARELAGWVRALDGSRLVTMGQDNPWAGGGWLGLDYVFSVLDVAGYNYALVSRDPQKQPEREQNFKVYSGPPRYLDDQERAPGRIMYASESFQFEVFANWKAAQHKAYVLGDFVWTAMDYLYDTLLGVPYPQGGDQWALWQHDREEFLHNPWYWRGAYCGDIDLIGWRKPASHYREIIWNGDRAGAAGAPAKKLYAAVLVPPPVRFEAFRNSSEEAAPAEPSPSVTSAESLPNAWDLSSHWLAHWTIPPALPTWTWPKRVGEALTVEVYSRYDAVRLYLNGKRIGEQPTGVAEEFKASFSVPYEPGELVAVGLQGGQEVERFALKTAAAPVQLRAVADRQVGHADGQDIIFVEIEARDAAGEWHPWGTGNSELPWGGDTIEVQVEGAGTLIGLGSANMIGSIPYQDPRCALFQGRALAAIRTTREPGPITVRVTSPSGLAPAELLLETRAK